MPDSFLSPLDKSISLLWTTAKREVLEICLQFRKRAGRVENGLLPKALAVRDIQLVQRLLGPGIIRCRATYHMLPDSLVANIQNTKDLGKLEEIKSLDRRYATRWHFSTWHFIVIESLATINMLPKTRWLGRMWIIL